MFCQVAPNATFSPTADFTFQETSINARLETLTAVLLLIQGFWDVTPYLSSGQRILYTEAQPTRTPIQVPLWDTGPYYILISSADNQKTRLPLCI